MEFLPGDPIVFANATIVSADRVLKGHVAVEAGRIAEVGEGGARDRPSTSRATIFCPVWSNCTPTIWKPISCLVQR